MARRASELIGVGLAVALLAGACDGTAGPSISPTTSATQTETPSDGSRVDLGQPTFSEPTSITNPLFPIGQVDQMIQLGDEAGESLRIEVTLLPDTRTIEYEDGEIADHEGAWLAGRDGPPGDHASRPRCR